MAAPYPAKSSCISASITAPWRKRQWTPRRGGKDTGSPTANVSRQSRNVLSPTANGLQRPVLMYNRYRPGCQNGSPGLGGIMSRMLLVVCFASAMLVCECMAATRTDTGYLKVSVTPDKAAVYVDGQYIRDLEGISEMDMPLYYRHAHPSYLTNVTLTGINIPIRIGNATVMPGDLVVGDPEGVYFIPPQMVKQVLDSADRVHIHDEWTRMKFAEGKYKSSEIYSSPRDPALRKEYDDYLKKRLDEINKKK